MFNVVIEAVFRLRAFQRHKIHAVIDNENKRVIFYPDGPVSKGRYLIKGYEVLSKQLPTKERKIWNTTDLTPKPAA